MLFSDSFLTISGPAEALFKDRGSKFIAYAYPVSHETEIKEKLLHLKKEHPSANHHCFAWRLGVDKLNYRVNDDGEPSGSAGKPIFAQIQSHDLTNICIVVVRYFGGTLLGVSGLINAYRSAAAEVIKLSNIEEQHLLSKYKIEFAMEDMSQIMRLIKDTGSKIISNSYEEKNIIVFEVKKSESDKLESRIKELYRTKLTFIKPVQ